NLLVSMRRQAALPEPGAPVRPEVPREAEAGEQRRRQFNHRRRRDVLGEGQPATWRRLVIKAAVRVVSSARRVVIKLSDEWPHLEQFRRLAQRLLAALATPPPPPPPFKET